MEALGLWLVSAFRSAVQRRRRVRVLAHRAFFLNGNPNPYIFVNVTNLSPSREIEVTHVWFEVSPRYDVVLAERPLPKRLKPDESWEVWAPASDVGDSQLTLGLARVRLTTGKAIKSRPNLGPPAQGYIPGRSAN